MKAANDPAMKTGLQSDFTRVSARLKEHESRLRDFTRHTGLVRQREREQVLGFGRSQASRAVWENRKAVEKYSKYHYNKDGTIVVTDDWKSKGRVSPPRSYKSFAVIETQTTYKNSTQIDRTIYDQNGILKKQIHGGPHNRPDLHPYGKYGEHSHSYLWDADGKRIGRTTDELTDEERIRHADILKGDPDG